MCTVSADNDESPLRSFVSLLSTAQTSLGVEVPKTSQHLKQLFEQDDHRPVLTSISNDTPCCSLPSLKLQQSSKRKGSITSNKQVLQESCAEKLSTPMQFTHEDLPEAPTVLIENLMSSFNYLVKSRIISCMRALVSQSDGGRINEKIMMKVLTAPNSKPIDFTTVVTSFRPFDEVVPYVKHAEDACRCTCMMLLFEVTMDVCLYGEVPLTVQLRTSGIAEDTSPVAESSAEKLNFVRIVLDNNLLLQQMMAQARLAAKKALQIAADTAQELIISSGISSSDVSLVSMSSKDSDLPQSPQFDEDVVTQTNDHGMMPPPPPRPRLPKIDK